MQEVEMFLKGKFQRLQWAASGNQTYLHPNGEKLGLVKTLDVPKGGQMGQLPSDICLLHSKAGFGREPWGGSGPRKRQGCDQCWKTKVLTGTLMPWSLSCWRCSCFCRKQLTLLGISDMQTIRLGHYSKGRLMSGLSQRRQGRGNCSPNSTLHCGLLLFTKESHLSKLAP